MSKRRVVILGGGLAGVTAARTLASAFALKNATRSKWCSSRVMIK
ncbi:MAG: hypothetical protein U0165_02790 [Polyangiaceae bacterium]